MAHFLLLTYFAKKTIFAVLCTHVMLTGRNSDENRSFLSEGLASLKVSACNLVHGDKCCFDDSHKLRIEQYYSDIVILVTYAESFMRKTNPNFKPAF